MYSEVSVTRVIFWTIGGLLIMVIAGVLGLMRKAKRPADMTPDQRAKHLLGSTIRNTIR